MRTLKIALVLILMTTLAFCGNDKKSNHSSIDTTSDIEVIEVDIKEEKTYAAPAINATFKNKKIGNTYSHYSKLQNALVNTNAKDAAAAAAQLKIAMDALGTDKTVTEAVSAVVASNDIKEQRIQFVLITAEMEKILANSLDSGAVYKMYCPMAFKNTGGYWLSSDKQVQNPYFGDKMYRCGRVDTTIQ